MLKIIFLNKTKNNIFVSVLMLNNFDTTLLYQKIFRSILNRQDNLKLVEFISTKQVCEILGQTAQNIAYLIKTGKITPINPQCYSGFLFKRQDIENYCNAYFAKKELIQKRKSKSNISAKTRKESSKSDAQSI